MLSFITYKDSPELEIVADDKGVDDLISFLQGIKKDKDHMHLIMGSEIDKYPVPATHKEVVTVQQLRLEFANTHQWEVR